MEFFVRGTHELYEEIRAASDVILEEFDLLPTAAAEQTKESLPSPSTFMAGARNVESNQSSSPADANLDRHARPRLVGG